MRKVIHELISAVEKLGAIHPNRAAELHEEVDTGAARPAEVPPIPPASGAAGA